MKKKCLFCLGVILLIAFTAVFVFHCFSNAQSVTASVDQLFSGTTFQGYSPLFFGLQNPIGNNPFSIADTFVYSPFECIGKFNFGYGGIPNLSIMYSQSKDGQYINGLQNLYQQTVKDQSSWLNSLFSPKSIFSIPSQNYVRPIWGIPGGQIDIAALNVVNSFLRGNWGYTKLGCWPNFYPCQTTYFTFPPIICPFRRPLPQPLPNDDEQEYYFSVILLPDTQYYSKSYPETYFEQINWIINHKELHNIKFVIHLGDITDTNTEDEWEVADSAHQMLENNNISYSVVPGNHDIIPTQYRDYSNFNTYFPASRFSSYAWYGGHFRGNENNYTFFEHNSLKFMVISLEFTPTKDAICWANNIINENSDRRVIVVTHCYQNADGEHRQDCDESYGLIGCDGNELWNEFVRRHRNISMVLSGHINGSSYKILKNNFDNEVHEILTDYQSEPNGGNGWLRVLKFYPDGDNTALGMNGKIDVWIESVINATSLDPIYYSSDPEDYPHKFTVYYDMTSPLSSNQFDHNFVYFSDRTINSISSGQQFKPAVAMDPSGNFVVAWEDDSNENEYYQIFARGFYIGGCSRFDDITVNTVPYGQQLKPAVAMDSNGGFVIVWEDDSNENGYYQIFARGFNADGTERFHDIAVNSLSNGQQLKPAVAMDSNGDFVVVWEDDSNENGYYQIFARGFNANGTERFHDITVNSLSNGQQLKPAVAMDSNGDFVVVWEDDSNENGYYQIFARGFYANGTERFHDLIVNSLHYGQQLKPAVAMDPSGNFVVVWEDDSDEDGYYQILARGFNASGTERFHDLTVNSLSSGYHHKPAVAMDPSGNFVVVWEDDSDENGYYQILARGFYANGTERFHDITVNSLSNGQQLKPAVAMDPSGNFVIAWEDDSDEDGYYQILARGFEE